MRVASWPLIAGRSLVVCVALGQTPYAAAWQPQDIPSQDVFEDHTAPPAATRWTGGRPTAQNLPGETTVADDVQQAEWNSSTQGTSSKKKNNVGQSSAADPGTAQPSSNSPTFHGYNLKMPTMPFGRPGANAQMTPNSSAAGPRQNTAGANRTVIASRMNTTAGGSPMASSAAMPQASTYSARTRSATAGSANAIKAAAPFSSAPSGVSRPSPTIRRGPTIPPTGQAMSGPVAVSSSITAIQPMEGPVLVAPDGKEFADHTEAPMATSAAASAADHLLLTAHRMAATANTEIELSHVIETCRRARASHPTPEVAQYSGELVAWAMNRRGQLRAESGRTKEAVLDFDDAVRLDPKCWRALHNRGVLLAQSGQFEKAFDDFNRTVQINPEFAKAYSNRAALFVVAGDVLPALEDYNKAIELDPNLSVAHRGRGRVCHLLGRLDEAMAHYDAAVQLTPNDAYAVASRADLMTDLGRYAEAASEYERAIQIDPSSAHAFRGSAWLLATCPDDAVRDAGLAVQRAEMAMRIEGREDSVSIDTLAAAQASGGDFAAATKTLGRAIELAPDNEREVYEDRLLMYQHTTPYRIAPLRSVAQASYQKR